MSPLLSSPCSSGLKLELYRNAQDTAAGRGQEEEAAMLCVEENFGCVEVSSRNCRNPVECWFHSENNQPLKYPWDDKSWIPQCWTLRFDRQGAGSSCLDHAFAKEGWTRWSLRSFQPSVLWFHEVSDWRQVLDSGNGLKGALLRSIFNTKVLGHQQSCTNAWFVHFLLNLQLISRRSRQLCHSNINCKNPSFE